MDEVEYCIVRKNNKLAADEIKKLTKGSVPTEVSAMLPYSMFHIPWSHAPSSHVSTSASCPKSKEATYHTQGGHSGELTGISVSYSK